MAALGFALGDVKLILNSHAHIDHAGGIAELARESGARVVMSPWSADALRNGGAGTADPRSEEHTSELQSLMRISYAVFCLQKKKNKTIDTIYNTNDSKKT